MFVVTGGAGFIGSVILAELERMGLGPLVVVDRLRQGDKWKNIAKRELYSLVHPSDILDFLNKNHDEIKFIIHMGAISATTETDVDHIIKNNFNLTRDLFLWCVDHQVKFIYASSAATYGDGEQGFVDGHDPKALAKLQPLNPYGWSKHLFDRFIARRYQEGKSMPPQWVGLKFFNVYGPNEYHKETQQSVVSQVYSQIKSGGISRLYRSHREDIPDGGQMRDFVWVQDAAEVIHFLMTNEKVSGLYNLGSGKARSYLDLVLAVYKAMNREPEVKFIDTPPSIRDKYQYFTEAKMDLLFQQGFPKSFTSLEEGIEKYVTQFLSQSDRYL